MLMIEYTLFNSRKQLKKINLYISIFLIISNLIIINCSIKIDEELKIIIFNHTKYNAGSKNKNGDLIIEYFSDENYYDIPASLLFYGLSKNFRYCFSNESSYTQEKNIDIDEVINIVGYYNNYKIYDSKSLFVSISNDFTKGKNIYLV